MKHDLSKRTIALTLAAFTLTAGLQIGSASAYFTAYTEAKGSAPISLGAPGSEIMETFKDWIKTVTVKNTGADPCYVRIRAVTGDLYQDGLVYGPGTGWTKGSDGYYYYGEMLQPEAETTEITVTIPTPAAEAEDFNVIVIQEYAPVVYDEKGNPKADWSLKAAAVSSGEDLGSGADKEGE